MDQEIVLEAIGSQLDALESIVNATVVLALVSAWAGISRKQEISIFSLEVDRREAYFLLGWTFVFANVAAALLFFRFTDLIKSVEPEMVDRALTVVATHSWVFNPYALFGSSWSAILHSCFGYGALISIWWIGFTCLAVLHGDPRKFQKSYIAMAFLFVGLASMVAIQLGFFSILEQLTNANTQLEDAVYLTVVPRIVTTFLGIFVGGLIFSITFKFAIKKPETVSQSRH